MHVHQFCNFLRFRIVCFCGFIISRGLGVIFLTLAVSVCSHQPCQLDLFAWFVGSGLQKMFVSLRSTLLSLIKIIIM